MEAPALVSVCRTKLKFMRLAFLSAFLLSQPARRILTALAFALLFSHPAVAGIPSDAPPASFPYELVGIARYDGVSYASIVDPQNGYHFLLSTISRSPLGLVLVSVATGQESSPSATIQKDGVSIILGLGETVSLDAAASVAPPLPASIAAVQGVPPGIPARINYPKPPPGATLPLVFQEVDPTRMTLTAEQKATLNQLRQDFISDLAGASSATSSATNATSPGATSSPETSPAGGNPNSTSNAQYQNWRAAQDKSDATFRMLFGTQAFNAYTESSSYPTSP